MQDKVVMARNSAVETYTQNIYKQYIFNYNLQYIAINIKYKQMKKKSHYEELK